MMVNELLVKQVRGDDEIAGMLARYADKPAFFFQKSPMDTDDLWEKGSFPRADFNIDMRYDPERKVSGVLSVTVFCTSESRSMPEDIEQRLTQLISGTFYTSVDGTTTCAIWHRSDLFFNTRQEGSAGDTSPEVFGVVVLFDLLQFPEQLTTDPDPIQGLNYWIRNHFPDMVVIAHDPMEPIWKPSDQHPAIYWRFEGSTLDRSSYAVNWYNGQFAAHIISPSVQERNRWLKSIAERIQIDGEVVLVDKSPMFARQLTIRHGADPLREGQLLLSGQYGVLAQQRRETAEMPLNHAHFDRR